MGESMYSKTFWTKGQTIIEVIVALTTAVVIVSAITIAVITALRNAEYSSAQNTATRYAQEGVEFLRFMRDSNFPQFKQLAEANVNYYCLAKGATTLSIPPPGELSTQQCTNSSVVIDDIYSRKIEFASNDAYCNPLQPPTAIPPATPIPTIANTSKKITVTVSWTDGKCPNSSRCHSAKMVSCLSDYTLVPTIKDLPTATPNP
jgi:Tfp pilus assembly protein PilV